MAVALAAAGASGDAAFGRVQLELLIVGGPIAVGIYALRSPVSRPLSRPLLAIGFAWSLTALGESPYSIPYTIGRLAAWLTFPGVVYVLLAFPHGRITKGFDRAVFAGVVGVIVVLFYGTAPFVQAFPLKTVWATCTTDCPPNAVALVAQTPAVLTTVTYVRDWLVELLWLGIAYSMYRRYRAASPLQRQAMLPVFVAGTLLGVVHCTFITARQLGVATDTAIALSTVWTLCIVLVCWACLLGLVRRRIRLAGALTRLDVALRGGGRAHTQDAVATALGDATARLLSRDPESGVWHDASGCPSPGPPPALGRDRSVTVIRDGRHEVALSHDVALLDDPELLEGVTGIVLAGWRHEHVAADLSRAMVDLEESRRRIAQAADLERARIERDLHDGAQQRLISLRIRLGLAEELLNTSPAAGVAHLHALGNEVDLALEDLRALAHGVYPPLLTDHGLPEALRSVAAQAPIPIQLTAVGVTRHPGEIEAAIYLTCNEAVQNALRHAHGATGVWITLEQTPSRLRFEVRDDGPGFMPGAADGRGLRNMHDRIEAILGTLTIEPRPGLGTRIVGSIPLP